MKMTEQLEVKRSTIYSKMNFNKTKIVITQVEELTIIVAQKKIEESKNVTK